MEKSKSNSPDDLQPTGAAYIKNIRNFIGIGNDPLPETVLSLDLPRSDSSTDIVMRVGDVALLFSDDGAGKSLITLAWALAATLAHNQNKDHSEVCGLCVRPGPVVIINYKDRPVDLAEKVCRITAWWRIPEEFISDTLKVVVDAPVLYQIEGRLQERGLTDDGRALWNAIEGIHPSMVIIDSASAALGEVADDSSCVRGFVRDCQRQARRINCGVLVVIHNTKQGAGMVPGSSAWYDGAQSVLRLTKLAKKQAENPDDSEPEKWLLQCAVKSNKSNYGWADWTARLLERGHGNQFSWLELDPMGWSRSRE